jgi:uncharacterized protein YabN with tetrapyrrole methylase and pyrophosphatase domain
MPRGSLEIVGTGIQAVQHMTLAARDSIKDADKVLYLLADAITQMWIIKLNPTAESLHDFYKDGRPRIQTYLDIVERLLNYIRKGKRVTFVSYGHPSVFCFPTLEVSQRCREEGFSFKVFPAVSSEDCLFADLGIDPGLAGCQSYEATDFLLRERKFSTSSPLILWQVGVVGIITYIEKYSPPSGLKVLVEYLSRYYPMEHNVIVYEASQHPIYDSVIQEIPLKKLSDFAIAPLATIYIPPVTKAKINKKMVRKLGMDLSLSSRKNHYSNNNKSHNSR